MKKKKIFNQFVNSLFQPRKLVYQNVAKLCLFLASNESSYINGSNIVIDEVSLLFKNIQICK